MGDENTNTNNEITLDVVQNFLETHKESDDVKALTQSFVNTETVESFLGTDEGKKVLQPKLDKNFTKGLETWKQNNLQKMIDAEINKKFPSETEEQKQLRALQEKLEKIEKEKEYANLKSEALQELNAKGLPTSLVDLLIADNVEATRDRINTFEKEFTTALKNGVDSEVEKRMKGIGISPESANRGNQDEKMTKEQLMEMDYNQRADFYNKNPEEFQRIMGG